MTLQNITAIIIRLFALLWLIKGLTFFIPLIAVLFKSSSGGAPVELVTLTSPLFLLIGSFIAWFYAPVISKFLTRSIDSNISLAGLTRLDLYCFSFVLIGLWFLLTSISPTLTWIHYLLRSAAQAGAADPIQDIYGLAENLITFILGFGCLLGAQKFSKLLIKNEEK